MFSGILEEFKACRLSEGPAPFVEGSDIMPVTLLHEATKTQKKKSADILPDSGELHQIWNCMTAISGQRHIFSVGRHVYSMNSRGKTRELEGFEGRCVNELIGCGRNSPMFACRDVKNNLWVLEAKPDDSLKEIFHHISGTPARFAFTPSGYCVSDKTSIAVYETGNDDPSYIFPEGGGPVLTSCSDPNLIFHGSTDAINILDMREGYRVSQLKVHPASISLTAYSHNLDYTLLTQHESRPFEIASFSQAHCVVQIFDTRKSNHPLIESALAGREKISSPYRHMQFSPNGKLLGLFQPLTSSMSVVSVQPGGRLSTWSCVSTVGSKSGSETRQVGRPRKSLSESCCGFSLGDSDILSITTTGNMYKVSHVSSKRVSSVDSARISDLPKMAPTKLKKLSRFLNRKIVAPVRRHLLWTEMFWIQCKVGACRGLSRCSTHPLAHKSELGSFYWNQCVFSCSVRRKLPHIHRKTSVFIFDIFRDFFTTYGYRLDHKMVMTYLRQLEAEESDIVSVRVNDARGTVDVEWTPAVEDLEASQPEPSVQPEVTDEDSSESEDVEMVDEKIIESQVSVFSQRKELVRPLLLFTSLPHLTEPASSRRLINPALVEKLRGPVPVKPTISREISQIVPDNVVYIPLDRSLGAAPLPPVDEVIPRYASRAGF